MTDGQTLFDDRASEYDQSAFHLELAQFVAALVPVPAGDVLDVATGTGLALRAMNGRADVTSRTGVDVSARMLEVARRELENASFVVAPAERLPFPLASFDVVLCVAALTYLDPVPAAAEWARVLRPGGNVLITAHEADGVTSSSLLRQAGRAIGIELVDPNAVTGSAGALDRLAATAGLKLIDMHAFTDRRPARLTEATFDLQLRYFASDMTLSDSQRNDWRERFLSLAAAVEIEEQRILVAHLAG